MSSPFQRALRSAWMGTAGAALLVLAALVGGCTPAGPPPEAPTVNRHRHDEEPPSRGTAGTNVRIDLTVCTEACATDRVRCNHGDACGCRGQCRGQCGGLGEPPRDAELRTGAPGR
ncbi:MAG: hypothetical protein HZA54_08310 [Planctomycetes bacterium]|nr:hypothetical protein [Planctomycetota bacterium]